MAGRSQVVCIGPKVFVFPSHGRRLYDVHMTVAPVWDAPSNEVFDRAPPFVVFQMDEEGNTIMDMNVLSVVEQCRFQEGRIVAVPWTAVLKWAGMCTHDKGVLFLRNLTLGSCKKELRKKPRKKRRLGVNLEDIAPLMCSGMRHGANTGSSTILTMGMVDLDYYKSTGLVLCTRCEVTDRTWSADGFLNLVTAKAVLNHMERDPDYDHLIDALLALGEISWREICFFRFGEVGLTCIPETFQLTLDCLFNNGVQFQRLIPILKQNYKHFGLASAVIFEAVIHAALNYRFFGIVGLVAPTMAVLLQNVNLKYDDGPFFTTKTNFELVVVSVFSPEKVASIFRDPGRRVAAYIHVFAMECDRLTIPGVQSVKVDDLILHPPSFNATLVLWPANSFTRSELETLFEFPNALILAGIPYLVPDRALNGLIFTDLIETLPYTYLGPNHAYSRELDQYPCKAIPITFFPSNRNVKLYCPVYEIDKELYFDRMLFTNLLSQTTFSKDRISVLPGPLLSPSLLAVVRSSKHVRPSHRERRL